jgi:hypothetical protein
MAGAVQRDAADLSDALGKGVDRLQNRRRLSIEEQMIVSKAPAERLIWQDGAFIDPANPNDAIWSNPILFGVLAWFPHRANNGLPPPILARQSL